MPDWVDWHPNGVGPKGPVESNAVNSGRNAENAAFNDRLFYRCSQCGFMNHLGRTADAYGNGVNLETTYGSHGRIEPIVRLGCPLCGTFNSVSEDV